MQKRRVYLLLIGAGVVAALVAFMVPSRDREPEYGGKRLTEWVEDLGRRRYLLKPGQSEADTAIHHIGTNALPYLLTWIYYSPAPWKTKLYHIVNPVIRSVNRAWQLTYDCEQFRALGAYAAFKEMGTNALPALPFLHQLMNDSNEVFRMVASNLVQEIEPESLERATR